MNYGPSDLSEYLGVVERQIFEGEYEAAIQVLASATTTCAAADFRRYDALQAAFTEVGAMRRAKLAAEDAAKVLNRDPRARLNNCLKLPLTLPELAGVQSTHLATAQFWLGQYEIAADTARVAAQESIPPLEKNYLTALAALAELRLGHLPEASARIAEVAKPNPAKASNHFFYAPRILYAEALIEAANGNFVHARELARTGREMAEKTKKPVRDVELGCLAQTEIELRAGDSEAARQFAHTALEKTTALFGSSHEDVAEALRLTAVAELHGGNLEKALLYAQKAFEVAKDVFGEDAPGVSAARGTLQDVLWAQPPAGPGH